MARRYLSLDVGLRHLAFADATVLTAGEDEEGGGGSGSGSSEPRTTTTTIHRWDVLDVTGGAKFDIEALTGALLETLDRELNDPSVTYDEVLIENQPATKNPLMKSVQMVLYTFFSCMRLYVGNVGAVKLVSATRKLRMKHAPPEEEETPPAVAAAAAAAAAKPQTPGAAYRDRKKESVRLCAHYLEHVICDEDRLRQLRTAKKKDDLSDSLMQLMSYVEQGKGRRHKSNSKSKSSGSGPPAL